MFPVLSLGPVSIPVPEFVLLLGFWAGVYLAEASSKNSFQESGLIERLLWTSLLAGVIGGRLSYFFRNPAAFRGDYLSLLALKPTLFDLPGGFLVSAASAFYQVSTKKLPAWQVLDHLAPFFCVLTAAVHLSRFASGSGYGLATDLPWGIPLWGADRHPVQLYYLLASLLVTLGVLSILSKFGYTQGAAFLSFLFLTCCYLLLLSAFQEPVRTLPGGLRPGQILSWFGILLSLVALNRLAPFTSQETQHDVIKG